jgi:hypothetical protein
MSSSSVTTSDGGTVIATSDSGDSVTITPPTPPTPPFPPAFPGHAQSSFTVGVHSDRPLDGASFTAGLLLGALLYFILQTAMRWHARREARGTTRAAAIGPQPDARDDGMAAAVAALARRTATLETIVTDPAQRTAREIDALR